MSKYLNMGTAAEFRKYTLKCFEGNDSKSLYTNFTPAREIAELDYIISRYKISS